MLTKITVIPPCHFFFFLNFPKKSCRQSLDIENQFYSEAWESFLYMSQVIALFSQLTMLKLNEIIYENPLALWFVLRKYSLNSNYYYYYTRVVSHVVIPVSDRLEMYSSATCKSVSLRYLTLGVQPTLTPGAPETSLWLQKTKLLCAFSSNILKGHKRAVSLTAEGHQSCRWVEENYGCWSKLIKPSVRAIILLLLFLEPLLRYFSVMRSTKKKTKQSNGIENDSRGKLIGTLSEQRTNPWTGKSQPWVDLGRSVMSQGIRGQAGYDLGWLEGQKKSHCHWTIMKEVGKREVWWRQSIPQETQLGIDSRSFWPQSLSTESLCYSELCRQSQRALIKAEKGILSENNEKTT